MSLSWILWGGLWNFHDLQYHQMSGRQIVCLKIRVIPNFGDCFHTTLKYIEHRAAGFPTIFRHVEWNTQKHPFLRRASFFRHGMAWQSLMASQPNPLTYPALIHKGLIAGLIKGNQPTVIIMATQRGR